MRHLRLPDLRFLHEIKKKKQINHFTGRFGLIFSSIEQGTPTSGLVSCV